uniref:Transformation/transcription domain-associated protein n=1 Tax=Cajanus cajan TaxID=3821 RepID=A0A151TIJ9_CAJCA|nr:Transformation/transcription domain-associated protein [Cajanus cajan]
MSPVQDFEQHSRHLVEADLPIQVRLQMVMEVRDSLEIAHTAEYLNFLKCYFRAFSAILLQITKPQYVDNQEHKLRNIVVEILNRLPHSEVLRPFVQDLLKVAMQVLTTDNEENGLICIRIIFDLLRNFRPTLENEVQPFLDFVCKIYQNFKLTVSHFFENMAMTGEDVKPMETSLSDQGINTATATGSQLNPSTRSFKIVTESPLVVMFLFQLYSRLVQSNIPQLLPLMVAAISVPGPERVPPHLKNHFIELKGAQVKTVSFLTYLLKSYADYIRTHEESICKSIVNLLVTCSDSVSIRKELLISLKHVLGTDFRRGLFPLIDTLLEERVLVGSGRACFETLRPLAYSLLAEIVHHVRQDLSLSQLSRIIYLFSSNMHDASLSLSIHTTCARLMLNLVEPIFEKGVDQQSTDDARILLGRILDAFVGKFSTFKRTIPQLLEEGEEGKDRATLRSKLELPVQAVLALQVPVEHSKEVNDCKHLIKTLVMGMKTIIWSITHAHSPRPQVMHPWLLSVCKASGVLKNGVHCLALFKEKDEEREMLHLFSQILAIMEPRDLMDMFSLCMPELFECMISNTQLVHIFSTLLAAPKVYRPFADVLVNFLVSSKLDVLKQPDSPAAKLVLHLFRFIFGAVAKAPSDFERILQPHAPVIMEFCMKNATELERPLGYMQLLRTMFKALSGCKYELLLRDLVPMLQPCLNMLLAMLEGPTGEDMRDLLLELCLTLPARLSSLLPYLSRLMKPLVLCLKGSDELVSLGLRTLEFWVDSLNPDFLEPIMASVISEVILALWSHLRPAPYSWGAKALQLLGKLGGRNRRFLKEPLALECKENPEHGLRLILTFEPATPFLVPLDRCINLAVEAVMNKNCGMDAFYRKQALKFLRVCLSSQLNLPGSVADEGSTSKQLSALLVSTVDQSSRRSELMDVKADLGVKTKTQLMAEKSVFKILLMTVVAANGEPDLTDPTDDFVVNICRHFAVIFHIDSSSSNVSATALGGSSLSNSVHVGSSVHVPVFEQLLPRLLHCCYGLTWQAQMGGVMGLGALVGKVTVETLCLFQVRIVRGLIYVLKKLPIYASKEQEETSQVLTQVLRVVNNADEANSEARKQSFQGVVDFLAQELFNQNASVIVRKNVQLCLALLASRTGSEVSELLEPLYQPFLQPLIVRSLKLKTVDQQVGTVTALNFCLALRPPLLKLTPELVNFLQEALQIAESDDNAWVAKFINPKVMTSLTKLRTACIELLCTTMAWADFKTPNHAELRAKIISMFFKSLTCRTPEIVAVAKEGLRQVINQRMPKELLQSSLRPILVNLAHTKNLSMPLLLGLARLLELLSNWFNVTLGGKLLEHLKRWLEPEKLAQSQKSWKAGEEPKIAAAIIELFHLLPPAASKFLDELVTLTIDLEGALPPGQVYSEINSPYRLPLTKFLNRYAPLAVDYFLARLSEPKYFRRFMYIIRSEAGHVVAPSTDASNPPAPPPNATSDAYFQGLALIKTLVKLIPGWLQSNRSVFDTLVLVWKSPARISRLQKEQELNLVQVKESKWLVKCFLNYLRHDKNEVNVLFDILTIFLFHSRIDYTFLKEFYIIEVAEGYPPGMKKSLLMHFLSLFQSKQLGHEHLVIVMQMLILPMLAHAFQNGQSWEVVDPAIIKTIVDKLLDPPEEVSAEYDEPLRIELLQLATLLLKYLQNDLVHHRKELIKFGWNHLKREDTASKQWAFVNVCHFLEAYQAPEKIILQVFVALLRTCQPENKMLVKQALDILMPALPRRLPLGDSRMPIWIRYTKKILVEEGHSIPNLIHIFQLIVRHSDLFYSCRAQFVPQMVNSLSRLGLPYNTTAENRRLAIELAGLVVNWERQRQNEMKVVTDSDAPNQINDAFNPSSADSKRSVDGQPDEEFKPNAAMEEMIINFLIRVALVIEPKDKEASAMYKQALELLSQALEVWPNANVKFNYLEKLLSSIQPSQAKDPSTALAQGLDVMNKVLEKQPHLFIRNNINQISQILEPCFKHKLLDAGKSFCSLLKMIFVAFPQEATTTPADVKLLYQKLDDLIQKHVTTVTALQTSSDDNNASSISFLLLVIKTLTEVQRNFVDPSILVRILQRLQRDMGSSAGSHLRQGQRTDPDSAVTSSRQGADVGAVISNLKSILKLITDRVMVVTECKRSVSQILNALLSEKGIDASVLLCILDVVKGWIEDDTCKQGTSVTPSAFLTPKEIVSFLQKLSQVDKQNFTPVSLEEWDKKYLELLYAICADSNKYPLPLRQEVFQKVERLFMLGLRARDPQVRMKFFSLYHESLGKTLFTRLQFIIQIQDWGALSDVFWLKQGLDLLLAILVEDKPITLAPNSARVQPLLVSSSILELSGMPHKVNDVSEGSEDAPLTFETLVLKHAQFLNSMSKLQVADLLIPLRELAHTDANVAYHLWVLVFPIVWVTLHKEEQVTLAKPMINLLSKDYHKRQQANRPNVVQALLEGLQLSHPQPRMPSELIKYIGKTYNAWHIALALLESHVMLFPNDSKCSESLAELYRLLNEEDMRCGLWKKRSVTAETRAGLSLVQHGYWHRAQSLFYQAMVKATQGTYNNTVPKAEMCLWEEQWLYCASQLSQWDALADFGKSVENYEILLDSLWKLPDWTYMKEHVIPKAQVEETPKLRLIQAYFALHDKNTNGVGDAENMVGKGVDHALEQWWQLPEMSVHSRIPLLQQFQQIVEVQESARILMDISNGNKLSGNSVVGVQGNLYADLKDILETWRLRTPNEWDNMSVWYDLLQWRNEMYNSVIDAFKDFGTTNSALHHLGYRDKAWTVNRLAHIARKQGLFDVCVTILEKLYGHSTMEVQEAFVKITEQAKAYLENKGEHTSGINLINSTNLEYFPAKHKAEIFRLKGDFFLKLNDSESANVAYSNAISLFKNLPKGWISWGDYCDMAYRETHEEIWLEYAVSCFLQGIKFGVSNSRSHLARVLYLLSFDTPNEPVGRAFDKYYEQVPHWVWLSWIPQLLLSLQRTEAPHCKLVLLKIATLYPQALYYWLRTYLLERRDVANKSEHGRIAMAQQRTQQSVSGTSAGSLGGSNLPSDIQAHQGSQPAGGIGSHDGGNSHGQEPERSTSAESNIHNGNDQPLQQGSANLNEAASAFDAAKDIMEALRGKHANLAGELEILLTEIGSRFVTLPEERLLAVVNALLHRCYKYPTATTAEVPQSLKKELSGVCRACFSADAVNKHVDFEIAPDHTVKLDRVAADIPIVRRHGSSFRRLTLIGSDGSQRHFIVQTSLTPNARSDERILQLFRVMNQMFEKHKESRRRHICIHTPIIIPVWSQVRMVEDDLMYSTFLEVYENHCARNDREADLPITYFKEQLNQAISGQISPEAVVDLRLQAYNEITKNLVNDNIFSQYMYKTLPSGNHSWAFKKQFAIQLALSSFMSFMLQIGGRSPNKILFAKNTGKIFQTDFHPAYDANGLIEFNEPVPFRLTRNMQAFFSHGVEGLIVSSMCAAAQAVASPKQSQHLWHHLAMFFRDELLSWSWRRPLGMPMAPMAAGGTMSPVDFKQKVITNVEHEENVMDPPQPVQRGVTELVEAALNPRNLCMMDPTWHPWF